ncbi:Short-chain dehydrogenase/reductase family protein [Pseudohyphozyma bogoriensis]|nr:Short-chain dehydrogenase/reductase family protein [Pseudohyphozyma bogoriensis]
MALAIQTMPSLPSPSSPSSPPLVTPTAPAPRANPTVDELRLTLATLSLDPTGNKKTLISRLWQHKRNQATAAALALAPPPPPPTRPPNESFDSFLVLDVEATCEQIEGPWTKLAFAYPNEIVEWPVILLKWFRKHSVPESRDGDETCGESEWELRIVDEFHTFVKPSWKPKLSLFCTELTGITQADVDSAPTYPEMLDKFQSEFIDKHNLFTKENRTVWCTDGPWFIQHNALVQSFFPPRATFDVAQIPDLSDKVVIVTGGNVGIGYETVKALLNANAKVYLAARDATKAQKAISELEAATTKKAILLSLDLADLASVRAAAKEFLEKESRLDVLFNNAGVMACPPKLLTAQNYDLQFGTNVLGHYYFTKLLLPALEAAQASSGVPSRVVHTSSMGHRYSVNSTTGFDATTLTAGKERDAAIKKLGSSVDWAIYGQSKLGNVVIAHYFAKTYSSYLVSASVHPGVIRSNLQRHLPSFVETVTYPFIFPASQGALTQLYAGTKASPAEMTGQYFVPWARVGKASSLGTNAQTEVEMITWLDAQIASFEKEG